MRRSTSWCGCTTISRGSTKSAPLSRPPSSGSSGRWTLAGDAQSRELARCLHLGAGLHQRQGRYAQALEWGERALQLAEQLGSLRDQA